MAAVCGTVDAGDELMYRLNLDKLLAILTQKCRAMVTNGLPASLEEARIRKVLEKPLASKLRDITEDEEALSTPMVDMDSQPIVASLRIEDSVTMDVMDGSLTPMTERPMGLTKLNIDAPEEIVDALRMQTAYAFIVASYIPAQVANLLDTKLTTSPLTPHISALA